MSGGDDNVVGFGGVTTLDLSVERVLGAAATADLERVVVVGTAPNGRLHFASSPGDQQETLWLLERARHRLMLIADEMDE